MGLVDDLASDVIYQLIEGPEGNKEEILATYMKDFAVKKKTHNPIAEDEIQIGNPSVTLFRQVE